MREGREFITLLGGIAATFPLAARAQEHGRIPRIGYLSPVSATSGFLARDETFRQGLRELGYFDGANIIIEYRFADGRFAAITRPCCGFSPSQRGRHRCLCDASLSSGTGCHKDNPHRHCGGFRPGGFWPDRKSCTAWR